MAVVIVNVSDLIFSLNGIVYEKNFQSLVSNDLVSISNVYDSKIVLQKNTIYSDYTVNGASYASAALLQSALIGVLFTSYQQAFGARLDNLEENQVTGVHVYETLASLPVTGALLVSYKVSNDPANSLNGYYHWDGGGYVKDFSLFLGSVVEGEVEAVEGGKIFDSIRYKADLEIGKNKYNKDASLDGYRTFADGTVSANPAYNQSEFIPVIEGESYTVNHAIRFHCFYDSDKNVVAGGSDGNTITFLVPAGVAFVVSSYTPLSEKDTFQLELGLVSTEYESYIESIKPENLIGFLNEMPEVIADIVYDTTINLYNKKTVTLGHSINPANGALFANPVYSVSDFIEVDGSLSYFLSGDISNSMSWFDADKVYISGTNTGYPLVSPVNAKYIRVQSQTDKEHTLQLEQNTQFTFYKSFYDYAITDNQSPYNGLLWSTMGDSVTELASWQKYVYRKLGLQFENKGVGGSWISGVGGMNSDARINDININSDVISVMGGTNDWTHDVVLGSISSSDVNEFYGALNVMCENLTTRFSTKKIILQTPPYSLISTVQIEASSLNTLGLSIYDYSNAIKEIGFKWGLPVIDTASGCGWNYVNIDTYVVNDGKFVHPNDFGGRRIASVVIGEFEKINPID